MENVQISVETLVQKAILHLEAQKPYVIDFDRNDSLTQEQKERIVKGGAEAWNDIIFEIDDRNLDCLHDVRIESIKYILNDLFDTDELEFIAEAFEDIEEFIYENELDLYYDVYLNYEQLLRNEVVNITATLYSNYDCSNSFYFETNGFSSFELQESYLFDVVKMLGICPQELKKHFEADGIKTLGKWPKKKSKQPAKVDSLAFYQEYKENSCPAVNFAFGICIDLKEFISESPKTKIKIHKGTYCGFYSSWQGGGSPFDLKVQEDFILDLNNPIKGLECKYTNIGINYDDSDYAIQNAYGLCNSFFTESFFVK